MNIRGFSLIETLTVVTVLAVLAAIIAPVIVKVREDASLAVSSNNIRMLAAGGAHYLADNRHTFWPYVQLGVDHPERGSGTVWWFGFETEQSRLSTSEGEREFDPELGPLGGYVPAGFKPDPSFSIGGKAFKPKYRSGYIGVGYNIHLGGGWMGVAEPASYWELERPSDVVVFSTSAQVNTFQRPASPSNPMLEEFYAIDADNTTVHFRYRGQAIVGFADGSSGFLPIDETTRDDRAPEANVGRFAPKKSMKYLK